MELNVHDLLLIHSEKDLIAPSPKPNWLAEAINRAPFVVIRRAHSVGNLIPVGIRGTSRNKRFAAHVHVNDFRKIITPEQITEKRNWIASEKELFSYLELINNIMHKHAIIWGPVGSVGFELASKVTTVNDKSDIDIIIRYTPNLTTAVANELITQLNKLPVPIDVQVETSRGSFSLHEYAHSKDMPILFKTKDGPLLKLFDEQSIFSR